jgi:uncharacterized protein YjbI with pentapeptide repeats
VVLRRVRGREVDLTGADLTGAHLREAELTDSFLINTTLTSADLRGVDLTHSSLRFSRVAGASFKGATLDGADLRNVDFREAHLEGTSVKDACHDESTLWPEEFDPGMAAPCPSPRPGDLRVNYAAGMIAFVKSSGPRIRSEEVYARPGEVVRIVVEVNNIGRELIPATAVFLPNLECCLKALQAQLYDGNFPDGTDFELNDELNFGVGAILPGVNSFVAVDFEIVAPPRSDGCSAVELSAFVTPDGFGSVRVSVVVNVVTSEELGSLEAC